MDKLDGPEPSNHAKTVQFKVLASDTKRINAKPAKIVKIEVPHDSKTELEAAINIIQKYLDQRLSKDEEPDQKLIDLLQEHERLRNGEKAEIDRAFGLYTAFWFIFAHNASLVANDDLDRIVIVLNVTMEDAVNGKKDEKPAPEPVAKPADVKRLKKVCLIYNFLHFFRLWITV
uniref:Uncharacterized protein n=1 Tax=Panagrolaimus superbus TaxID=310955 RepID=A0A914YPG5_9BILA